MVRTFTFYTTEIQEGSPRVVSASVTIALIPKKKGLVFTASGQIWKSTGQVLDDINQHFADNTIFSKIYRLWKLYHLNDMHAGTERQDAAVAEWEAEGNAFDYIQVRQHLASIGLLIDEGYEYGSGWRFQTIPDADLKIIRSLFEMEEEPNDFEV